MSDYYEMFLNVNCIFLTLYLVLCQIWGKKVTKTFLVETEGSARKIPSKKARKGVISNVTFYACAMQNQTK